MLRAELEELVGRLGALADVDAERERALAAKDAFLRDRPTTPARPS